MLNKSNDSNELQLLNIEFILATEDVTKLDISKYCKE